MIYMGLEIGLDVLEKVWKFIGKNVWEPWDILVDFILKNNDIDSGNSRVASTQRVVSLQICHFHYI